MGSSGDSLTAPTNQILSHASTSIEPSHLLYHYPSDPLRTILVSSTFNGLRYGCWRRSMLIGLSCKNKLGLINGSVAKPSADSILYE